MLHAIRAFRIDVVLVIDHERLYADIKNETFGQPVECIKLRKSGGVVSRDQDTRYLGRQDAIRDYFYGPHSEFYPHSIVVAFNVLKACRVGGGPQAPSTALPIGAERALDVTKADEVEIDRSMVNTLCALTYSPDIDGALAGNLCGFVLITNVDEDLKRCTMLSPSPGKLPCVVMLVSDIQTAE